MLSLPIAKKKRTLSKNAENKVIKTHVGDGDSYATKFLQKNEVQEVFFNTIRRNGKTRLDQSKILINLNLKALCEALEDRLAQTGNILNLDKWRKQMIKG